MVLMCIVCDKVYLCHCFKLVYALYNCFTCCIKVSVPFDTIFDTIIAKTYAFMRVFMHFWYLFWFLNNFSHLHCCDLVSCVRSYYSTNFYPKWVPTLSDPGQSPDKNTKLSLHYILLYVNIHIYYRTNFLKLPPNHFYIVCIYVILYVLKFHDLLPMLLSTKYWKTTFFLTFLVIFFIQFSSDILLPIHFFLPKFLSYLV